MGGLSRHIHSLFQEFKRIPRDPTQARSALTRIRDWLTGLSLPNHDFDAAVRRINNAYRYLESAEFGAARYEIGLLHRTLKTQLDFSAPHVAKGRQGCPAAQAAN
jgi:hypothetical protein